MVLEHKLIAFKREFHLKVNSKVLPSCQESLKIHYIPSLNKDILLINWKPYIYNKCPLKESIHCII